MKKYYLHNGNENIGPFDLEELKAKGIIKTTMIWYEGMENWIEAGKVDELKLIFTTTPPPIKKIEQQVYKKSKGLNSIQKVALVILLFIIGAIAIASINDLNNEQSAAESSFIAENEEANRREIRNNIESSVGVYTNKYSVDPFGGITNLDITVANKTDYIVNKCEVEVQYIKENGGVFKTEYMTLNNISAHQDKTISAPDSNRGLSVNIKITSINSNELELCFSSFLKPKAGDVDPYKCK